MIANDEAINWAVSFIERLENPSASLAVLHPMKQQDDGSYLMAWWELSADADEFVAGLFPPRLEPLC